MRVDAILMEPKRTRLALLLLAGLSIGCGAVRNPALEYAREAYQKARQDPVVVRHAAVALDRAERTLEEADRLWTKMVTRVSVEIRLFGIRA
jgi:Domain of unknown function (DUF4398)